MFWNVCLFRIYYLPLSGEDRDNRSPSPFSPSDSWAGPSGSGISVMQCSSVTQASDVSAVTQASDVSAVTQASDISDGAESSQSQVRYPLLFSPFRQVLRLSSTSCFSISTLQYLSSINSIC